MKGKLKFIESITRKKKRFMLKSSKGNSSVLTKKIPLMSNSLSSYARNKIFNSTGQLHSQHHVQLHSRTLPAFKLLTFETIANYSVIFKLLHKSNLTTELGKPLHANDMYFVHQNRPKTNKSKIKGNTMASIIHADDSISTRLFAEWITSNYSFSLDKFISIQEPTIDKVIEDKRFKKVLVLDGGYTNYLVINDDAMVVISQNKVEYELERSEVYFEIFAKDIDTYYEYYNYIMDLDKASKLDTLIIEYHSLSLSGHGSLESNVEYFKQDIFNDVISDFYTPYLDTDLLFEQFMKSRSVMLQFTGKPGIGKSKLIALFVKYLADHPEFSKHSNVIKIARAATSEVLAEEDFWIKLRQDGFQALILDDVDHILQKRNESVNSHEEKLHNEIIRKILTFTDGLTSQKSKILISTNLEYHKVDKALIRDIRLFDSIELRALTYKEAKHIWVHTYGLSGKRFKAIFGDITKITAAKLAKEIESLHNDTSSDDQDSLKSYLKEDGISKVKSLRENENRIGFG